MKRLILTALCLCLVLGLCACGGSQPAETTQVAEAFAAGGLVVPSGSLPDELRVALAPLAPAFDAAEQRIRP